MFDRHVHQHGPSYPQTVNIHEHRAPTDDSIRLANEMREKIEESVVVAQIRGENSLQGEMIEVAITGLGRTVYCGFKLNGKDICARVELDSLLSQVDPASVYRKLVEEFSAKVTEQISGMLADFTMRIRGRDITSTQPKETL